MDIEQLLKTLGRCVYYHAGLAKHFGGVNPALFFSQIHYWQDKTDNPLGVYKSAEVLREETGMTYREQASARAQLQKIGVLIETHKRLEHRIYFRIDYKALQSFLANVEKRNSRNAENAIGEETKTQVVNKTEMYSEMKASSSNQKTPDCPHQKLIDLFGDKVPELPKPRVWTDKRMKDMAARWKWAMSQKDESGQPKHQTADDGIQFFGRFFDYVATSDFLTGRNGAWAKCDLPWLMKEENFAKVIEGQYENKGGM